MEIGRRDMVAGLAAGLLLAGRAEAAPPDRLFAGTPLAGNHVAASFSRVDLALPDVVVVGPGGRQRLAQLAGKARLLTLWAEWCVPCLLEARDLAALRPRVASDRFDIVSVLTGSNARLDRAGALARLKAAGVTGLELLVEPDGGHAIVDALSTKPPVMAPPPTLPPGARIVAGRAGYTLPCTLLVDRMGRVRGRTVGIRTLAPPGPDAGPTTPHMMSEAEKRAMLDGPQGTTWSGPDGLAFLRALGDGALDRV